MINIDTIRSRIPCLEKYSYLNMSYGPKSTPVVDEVVRLARLTESAGTLNPDVQDELWRMYEKARDGVARLLSADRNEIAMTRHVTEGMNIVATGMDWSPGDEVIISDEEHPGGSLPWMNLARRRGINVKMVEMTYDLEELLSRLGKLIGPKTKIVSLSHVSTVSGFLMPAKEITEFVHKKGIPIVFDGAHAGGLVDVNVKEIGCDFYTTCGHKWLMAPQGTGFLYVNKKRLDELQVTWLGAATTENWDLPTLTFDPKPNANKFEYGTRDLTVYGGLSVALDISEEVGIENISARSTKLATIMKNKVTDMPFFELMTPMDSNLSTGVVTIIDQRNNPENPSDRLLKDHNIIITGKNEWTRISFPYYTLEEEVDKLAEALNTEH
ncbi:MAG: aminotransferase class V-fold PLP-dependent enzyme [Chloroflexota bacterium]|nr:aminotransferase class V-fold PLP-dependent enzyme [Chloroflexota bacterium]